MGNHVAKFENMNAGGLVVTTKVGIGQDSHRIDFSNKKGKLILGGTLFNEDFSLDGNSDADVVLHAITNAISSVTGTNILGKIADKMCIEERITDSVEYVKEAMKYLGDLKIVHIAISIECKTPAISPKIEEMKENISRILEISKNDVGITATTGEGLTQFGEGKGIQCFACITMMR